MITVEFSFRADQDGERFSAAVSAMAEPGRFSLRADIDRGGGDSGTADLVMAWGDEIGDPTTGTVTIVRAKPGRPLIHDDDEMLGAISAAFRETGLLREAEFVAIENTDTRTEVGVRIEPIDGLDTLEPGEFESRLSGVRDLFTSLLPALISGFRATDDAGDVPPPEPPSWD